MRLDEAVAVAQGHGGGGGGSGGVGVRERERGCVWRQQFATVAASMKSGSMGLKLPRRAFDHVKLSSGANERRWGLACGG